MSHTTNETLSALLDNEADDLELRRLLQSWDQLGADEQAQLARTWSRYHLAQALIHEQGTPVSDHLGDRISARLADEPALTGRRAAVGWQQTLLKVAVAASVAAIFFVGMQSSLQQQPGVPLADTEQPAPASRDLNEAGEPGPAGNGDGVATLVADAADTEAASEGLRLLYDYIQAIKIEPSDPASFIHIEDSPLYRLVNDLQDNTGNNPNR